MGLRKTAFSDRLIEIAEIALTGAQMDGHTAQAKRLSPALNVEGGSLDTHERLDVAGMMRVNHSGEVCAQALYMGQAAVARNAETRRHLLNAAAEELDHLNWCQQRLEELRSRPSLLNPLWYAGSFAIGTGAALFGDRISLGFVVETERQVEAHLAEHLRRIPGKDQKSRAILETMRREEAGHGAQAIQAGGQELPERVKRLMSLSADVMKAVAYRI